MQNRVYEAHDYIGSRVILSPLRMTRSAQDDSVRYETSHVPRHCKGQGRSPKIDLLRVGVSDGRGASCGGGGGGGEGVGWREKVLLLQDGTPHCVSTRYN